MTALVVGRKRGGMPHATLLCSSTDDTNRATLLSSSSDDTNWATLLCSSSDDTNQAPRMQETGKSKYATQHSHNSQAGDH